MDFSVGGEGCGVISQAGSVGDASVGMSEHYLGIRTVRTLVSGLSVNLKFNAVALTSVSCTVDVSAQNLGAGDGEAVIRKSTLALYHFKRGGGETEVHSLGVDLYGGDSTGLGGSAENDVVFNEAVVALVALAEEGDGVAGANLNAECASVLNVNVEYGVLPLKVADAEDLDSLTFKGYIVLGRAFCKFVKGLGVSFVGYENTTGEVLFKISGEKL